MHYPFVPKSSHSILGRLCTHIPTVAQLRSLLQVLLVQSKAQDVVLKLLTFQLGPK
jgi:hypothetical protein